MSDPNAFQQNLSGGAPQGSPFQQPAAWNAAQGAPGQFGAPQQPHPATVAPHGSPTHFGAATAAPTAFQVTPQGQQMLQGRRRTTRAAMIWGIAAIVSALVPIANWFTLVPAIFAIQLGAATLMQKIPGKGMAITGLVLGIVSIPVAGIAVLANFVLIPALLGGMLGG